MHNILQKIIAQKKKDVDEAKKNLSFRVPLSGIEESFTPDDVKQDPSTRSFHSLGRDDNRGNIAIIAEIKLASPSGGKFSDQNDIPSRVKSYEKAGVESISVVTEKHFFKGDIGFVSQVKKLSKLPVLQKDFVIDDYQIYEAKTVDSDALLLIARIVSKEQLKRFVLLAQKLGMEPVVEVQNLEDLEKAVETQTRFIAVNARDLNTFVVDVGKACKLMKKIPSKFIRLGFSGIHSATEVQKYADAGAKGVLVGTSLMKAKNISQFLLSLRAPEGSVAI